MSIPVADAIRKRRLRDVLREYRQRGYVVMTAPVREHLPAFLDGFRFEAIAMSERDNVVIRVLSREQLKMEGDDFTALASAVERQPGWRLELVTIRSQNGNSIVDPELSLDVHEARVRIGIARELLAEGQAEVAAMVVWTATESLLRRRIVEHGVDPAIPTGVALSRQLYVDGELSKDDYAVLKRAGEQRHLVAHGYHGTLPADEWVPALIDVAEELAVASAN